ncbi:polyprenyl synthetase [Limosilactobacillus sp. STM2_1]|uniref:Polyprenyl synthetase n=1 Tax=Limosilactobacillus rudii TaxID=2759755 RepID=A0A7W3UME2_9LACO|nr:polyprenyl synthetase [Limosilactobacillus rudii]MBB1098229.1 polyprenyl synthetase [Limosilactobacillus rudii]
MEITPDERLTDALGTIINQFPPMVKGMVDLNTNQDNRQWRLTIFDIFSHLSSRDLIIDQITAAQLPELLALAVQSNPPFFQPAAVSPNELAKQKAYSYLANYLMGQFTRMLNTIGNPPQVIEELTVDAGDIMLAQIQRLQFNYNQRFRVANYLADIKARDGLLAAMSAKQSSALTGVGGEVVSLAGQIGQALGTVHYIIAERNAVKKSQDYFNKIITAGHYPLALLFAQQSNSEWFTNFFNQKHRPSLDQFKQAYHLSLEHIEDVNEMITDIISQLKLDIKVLPTGRTQDELLQLIDKL